MNRMAEISNRQLSFLLGEFKDRDLEKRFASNEFAKSVPLLKTLILTVGIVFFLFFIPDSFVIINKNTLSLILINRIAFLLIAIMLYFWLKDFKAYRYYSVWVLIFEAIAAFFFLLTYYHYEPVNFFIQTLGVIVLTLVVFLIENRLIYMVTTSIAINLSFIILSLFVIENIDMGELFAVIVYLFLVTAIGTFSTMRIKYDKRLQYLREQELIKQTTVDTLTGAYNRNVLYLEIQKWINYVQRYNVELALIMFDIDDFKRINDTFGHLAGDRVLAQVSELVQQCIRNYDILIRWGGEEFVILTPHTSLKNAVSLAIRIKDMVNKTEFGPTTNITCSFGVTVLNRNDDLESFIKRADELLYIAKNSGKNQVVHS